MDDLFLEEGEAATAPEAEAPEETQFTPEHLIFRLGDLQCAFPVMQVREVSEAAAITRVPNVSAAISGVINLRGSVLPVLDLRNILSLPAHEGKQILILRQAPVGLLIGETVQIMPFVKKDLSPLPAEETQSYGQMSRSRAQVQGRSILLLDADMLMASKSLFPA